MRDYEGEKEDYPGQPGWSNAIRIFKDTDGSPYPTWVRVIEKIAQVAEMGDSKRGHLGMVPEIVKRGAVPEELQEEVLAVHSRNKTLLEEIDSSNWEESKALYEEGKLESKKRKELERKNSIPYLKELGLIRSIVNLEIDGETFEIQINDSGEVECWYPCNMYMGSLSVNQVQKPDFNLNGTLKRMLAEAFEGTE